MHVLVIGGAGYVGPAVVESLRQVGERIRISGLDAGWFIHQVDSAGPLPENAYDSFRLADVRDLDESDLEGVEAVVYLAAISNDPMGDRFRDLTFEINQREAYRVARLASSAGVSNFVFASSASVYGAGRGDRRETDELSPQTAYAESKIQAEGELATLASPNFRVTCLRFATACGWSPRIRLDLVLNDFVATALTKGHIEVLSDGTPWRPLIHVKDMARAIQWSVSEERTYGADFITVNVGSEQWNFQIRDLARAVAGHLGGVDVSINNSAALDLRSYRLDFSLWRDLAPNHQPRVSLTDAISDLANHLITLPDLGVDFRNSSRIRLRQLEAWRESGYLGDDLRWRR
jgi:nucleoside-diphosphate-sugar epimerase